MCKSISHASLPLSPPNHCHLTVLAQVLKTQGYFT